MQTLSLPSTEYLHECFDYDHGTGLLRWKHRPRYHFTSTKGWEIWNGRYVGTIAGNKQRHCRISLAGNIYRTHRIVWKWVTGEEPPANIDHKNRNGHDNRWANLREATQTKQNWNKSSFKNNASGHKGVCRDRSGKWRALIKVNGTQRHIGNFSTIEEASAAYEAAARELHGEFYYGGRDRK